ncbi:MAG: adenosylmethionine--8-amino-7-oxononanoate transaminase, partial [Lentisphaerota bacterium]
RENIMTRETHIWHPYTRFSTLRAAPLPIMVKGEGIYLYDEAGNRYVDAISSWWACALGHGHPRIIAAIQKQVAELQHSILGNLSHPRAEELAERLANLMPTRQRHVLFASDGASAVEAALKIALQYAHNTGHPERKKLAYLEDAYHGDTLGAVAVGYLEAFHKPFENLLAPSIRLPVPAGADQEEACFTETVRRLEQHRDEIAALIVEPLCQGAAGMKMYSASYLRRLTDLFQNRGLPLIVDEIATGFGRTGSLFAFEQAGIDPDIVCVGKALSAGYLPISAALVKDEIYQTFDDQPVDHSFYHGHTFCGNPIAAAAALEALKIYQEDQIVEKAVQLGKLIKRHLSLLQSLEHVKEIRCLGCIGAVEMKSIEAARRIRDRLFEQRILARPLGPVVYLMPPLNTPPDVITEVAQQLCEIIRETENAECRMPNAD